LLVKPLQAQKLSLAATRGTISLALRSGQGPSSEEHLSAITFPELLRAEASLTGGDGTTGEWVSSLLQSKTAPVDADPRWEMIIYRGPSLQELIFENATSSRRLQPTDESTSELGVNPDEENFDKLLGQSSQ